MFTRTTGFVIVPAWLLAMGWLVFHDVVPRWLAREAPPLVADEWLKTQGRRTQYEILGDDGPLGNIWTSYFIEELSVRRSDVVYLDRFPVPIAPCRLEIESNFTAEGQLDEFTLDVDGAGPSLRLHGERFHSAFSFVLQAGPQLRHRRSFKLPLAEGSLITAGISPLTQISGLEVGQRWRLQVVNPVAVVTGLGDRFTSVLVEVVGRETLATEAGPVECFVLEASTARMWLDQHGVVQMQQIDLPLVGRLRLVLKGDFDENALAAARRSMSRQGTSR